MGHGGYWRASPANNPHISPSFWRLLHCRKPLKGVNEICRYPLRESARDILNCQLRSGIRNQQLAELEVALRAEVRLCYIEEGAKTQEPHIICSLGLNAQEEI